MRINPTGVVVFVAFCALLMLALSNASGAVHAGEAAATLLILAAIGRFAFR
jgi:hypothetical protein